MKEMIRLMGPRTLGLAVSQFMVLILTVLASTFVVGSLTIFQFAYNIEFFPVGIIGVSFAIAVFPTLSELAQKNDMDSFIDAIANTTRQLLYLLIPMTLLFLIFRAQIVRVVVGAGEFDWAATIATADTLAFLPSRSFRSRWSLFSREHFLRSMIRSRLLSLLWCRHWWES